MFYPWAKHDELKMSLMRINFCDDLYPGRDLDWLISCYVSGKRLQWTITFSMGKSTISMAVFNSYVKLPEGTSLFLAVEIFQFCT